VTANVLTTTESVGDQLLDTSGNPYNVQPVPASSIFPPGTGVQSTFVYRPGGVAAGNVYTTVPTLYAALNAAAPISPEGNRPPTTIQIDDSVVSPAVWPAGAYNIDSVIFTGIANYNNPSGGAALEFANGTTCSWGNLVFTGWLYVTYQGVASPCYNVTAAGVEVNTALSQTANLSCPGGQPFMEINNAGSFAFVNVQGAAGIGDGVNPVFSAPNANTGGATFFGLVSTLTDAFVGAGWTIDCDMSSYPSPQGAGVTVTIRFLQGATAGRSATPTTGQMYFDTTIGKPVWWNGANWVNALGVIS
jgi:hypothetical protein